MKSLRCHWCNGPNGIVCGPKLIVCQKCRDKEERRAKERLFQEEHDGESSAEYYGESGVSGAQDEAMREREYVVVVL